MYERTHVCMNVHIYIYTHTHTHTHTHAHAHKHTHIRTPTAVFILVILLPFHLNCVLCDLYHAFQIMGPLMHRCATHDKS